MQRHTIIQEPKLSKVTDTDRSVGGLTTRHARLYMGTVLMMSDAVAILFSGAAALSLWNLARPDLNPGLYVQLIPLIAVFLVVFFLSGLYPAIGLSPVEEFRRLILATTGAFLGMATLSFYIRNVEYWSRASFGLALIFALLFIPLMRGITRKIFCHKGWWGEKTAILGYGKQGQNIVAYLRSNPRLGIKPAVIINGFDSENEFESSIPVLSVIDLLAGKLKSELHEIRTAILIVPEVPSKILKQIIKEYGAKFPHLVMVSEDQQIGSVWITPYDLGGILGLEVKQNLLDKWQQRMKRAQDILIVLLFSPFLLFLFGLLALAIRLDSKGSVFYKQKRIGQDNRAIWVWKFRTMVDGAEKALDTYLQEHPECREEWEASHKLKNDPRITLVGKFLRRSSLDELPQIINVILGQMSLVGPRPIVEDEVKYYDDRIKLYHQVLPGITGLWQISGRNDLEYNMRVRLDEYYVRNWSIWLDLFILSRTIFAVLSGKGAY